METSTLKGLNLFWQEFKGNKLSFIAFESETISTKLFKTFIYLFVCSTALKNDPWKQKYIIF